MVSSALLLVVLLALGSYFETLPNVSICVDVCVCVCVCCEHVCICVDVCVL